jgi:hypothetical protein
VCRGFECRYISAHRGKVQEEKDLLPHPVESGAYVFEVADKNRFALFIDPQNPQSWWRSRKLLRYLELVLASGFTLQLTSQVGSTVVSSVEQLRLIVAAFVEAFGPNR